MAAADIRQRVDFIVLYLKKGLDTDKILSKYVQKWGKSEKTFDRDLQKAQKEYEPVRNLAKKAANEVYVKANIEAAKEAVMTEIEAKKLVTDIARGNLTNYMTIKKVEHVPRIEITIDEYIKRLEAELLFEEDFARLAGLNDKEKKAHIAQQTQRRREILRQKLLRDKNPNEKRIVNGAVEWEEVAELDMVKLIADKEQGKIKSLKYTQYGLSVEMYGADAAATNILKIHGSFAPEKQEIKTEISLVDAKITFR